MKAKKARSLVSLLLVGSILVGFMQAQGTSYVTYTLTTTQATTYTSWSDVVSVGTGWDVYVRMAITYTYFEAGEDQTTVQYWDRLLLPDIPGVRMPDLQGVATFTSARVVTFRSPVMVVVTETRPRVLTVVSTYTSAPDVLAPAIGLVVIIFIYSLVGIVLFWSTKLRRWKTRSARAGD